ncbi:MAG: orotate phosphoribosyltransferase [Thermoplasmata archaeon]|nr:MAG: orotate phosphoribosyltransferase [Thermoplasmata archaeon]
MSELVDMLISCGAVKFGRFILTSGKESNYYIDIKQASTNPEILRTIAEEMKKYAEGYDMIAGMELGAVPIAVALSLATSKPYVIVRKETKAYGTRKLIEGGDVNGKKVLVVEDVTTTGGSVIKTIEILRQNGAKIDRVVTVVDREEGARERLTEHNVELVPLVSATEILKKR